MELSQIGDERDMKTKCKWDPGLYLGKKKHTDGKSGEIRIKSMIWVMIL